MDQLLCSRCEALDIRAAFLNPDLPATGVPIVSLGKRLPSETCTLCRFFLDLSPSYQKDYELHARLFDHIGQLWSSKTCHIPDDLPKTRFLSVHRENDALVYDSAVKDETTQKGLVALRKSDVSSKDSGPIRSVNKENVDYELLSSLIKRCKETHSLCNHVHSSYSLSYIYLIDCVEERVVREHPSQTYMTLSYVWGQPITERGIPNSAREAFPNNTFSVTAAPLTIQDAIRVVRKLGRRYLWVDKYCIDQTDSTEQKLMLDNMGHIYRNAEATIVALYGDNDAAGLPGVFCVSRKAQPQFQASNNDGFLISSCPPISTLVQTSTWGSRGWTYQEARLSRRCLFFTEYQVYLTCQETTSSEAVPGHAQEDWVTWLLNSHRLEAPLFTRSTSIAPGIWLDRYAFTQRALTYDSDILNAFRGIMSNSGFVNFWGVPITPPNAQMDAHTGFALGLLWTRCPYWAQPIHLHKRSGEKPQRTRRPGFPTWSWASVAGGIFNEGYGPSCMFRRHLAGDATVSSPKDNAAHIRVSIYMDNDDNEDDKKEGVLVLLHDAMQRHRQQQKQNLSFIPETSHRIVVKGDIVQVTRTYRNGIYQVVGLEHLALGFTMAWDLGEDNALNVRSEEPSPVEDALVLVDWVDGRGPVSGKAKEREDSETKEGNKKNNNNKKKPGDKRRFVLMLLKWIDPAHSVAERRGIISGYKFEYDAEDIRKIPRTRSTFTLV